MPVPSQFQSVSQMKMTFQEIRIIATDPELDLECIAYEPARQTVIA
jgi:hypothetical protein